MHRNFLYFMLTLPMIACDIEADDGGLDTTGDEGDDVDDKVAADDPAGRAAALDPLAEAPGPDGTFYDCPGAANFCFWYAAAYNGVPLGVSGGDFAINFQYPVYSLRKREGTLRVKVFSGSNFTGSCKVVGPEGAAAAEPYLPFAVYSARRMEVGAKGC